MENVMSSFPHNSTSTLYFVFATNTIFFHLNEYIILVIYLIFINLTQIIEKEQLKQQIWWFIRYISLITYQWIMQTVVRKDQSMLMHCHSHLQVLVEVLETLPPLSETEAHLAGFTHPPESMDLFAVWASASMLASSAHELSCAALWHLSARQQWESLPSDLVWEEAQKTFARLPWAV